MKLLLKRLLNLLPLAGLIAVGIGLYGLFGPSASAGLAQAGQEDPSLINAGFIPQLQQPEFNANRNAWRKLELPTLQSGLPADSPAAPIVMLPVSTPTAVPTSAPTAGPARMKIVEPEDAPAIPDRIVIPTIDLDAEIVRAPTRTLTLQQQVFEQWLAPDAYAVGWHQGSAFLGRPGNTVLNGHHNVWGKVFGHLVDLQSGDEIILYSGQRVFHYIVTQTMILKERGATLAERQENSRWIRPSDDQRLTLVTCWPADSNTHRLLVVASPQP